METMTERLIVSCPKCGRTNHVSNLATDNQVGEQVMCAACGHRFAIRSDPWNLDADLRERLAGASDAPSADHAPRSEHRSKAFGYVDSNISRALCAADNQRVLESPRYFAPPTVTPPDSKFGRPVGPGADFARLPTRRPDGFDQSRIDEIKAALLATGRKR